MGTFTHAMAFSPHTDFNVITMSYRHHCHNTLPLDEQSYHNSRIVIHNRPIPEQQSQAALTTKKSSFPREYRNDAPSDRSHLFGCPEAGIAELRVFDLASVIHLPDARLPPPW
jgi:hypothetical protein